jgi:hypothetical protein
MKNYSPHSLGLMAGSAYLLTVALLTWLRPIHQDDGWYAANAFNIIVQFWPNSGLSEWSFETNSESTTKVGFVYYAVQLPLIALFGPDLLFSKILVFICAVAALYFIYRLFATRFAVLAILSPAILLLWPGFWYHFYNRPEMFCVAIGIAGACILSRSKPDADRWVAIAYALPWLCFDAHPISVFLIFGFYLWHFISSPRCRLVALFGSLAGLAIYLMGNWAVNGSFGLFSSLLGQSINRGDHYIPLLESDFADIIRIAWLRHELMFKLLAASALWVPPLLFPRQFVDFVSARSAWILLFNSAVFWVLSALFSEAISNGFMLYNILAWLSLFVVLTAFTLHIGTVRNRLLLVLLAPSLAALAYVNYHNIGTASSYLQYAKTFYSDYSRFSVCVPENGRALMRPTFAFAGSRGARNYEYTFNILFWMKEFNASFGEIILRKNFDVVAIDPQDQRDMFGERQVLWDGKNPLYNSISDIHIDPHEVAALLRSGALVEQCQFDEFSHGNTIFYAVNRDRLRNYLSGRTPPT